MYECMKTRTFLCTWKIKNYARTSCYESNEAIFSPPFTIKNFEGITFSLRIYPKTMTEGRNTVICLLLAWNKYKRLREIPFYIRFMLLNSNGVEFKRLEIYCRPFSETQEYELIENEDLIREISQWSENILILQCYMECESYYLMPLESDVIPVVGCNIETDIFNDSVFLWFAKLTDFQGWPASREILIGTVRFKATFRYVDDELKVELIPNLEHGRECYFSCQKMLIEGKNSVIISSRISRLFSERNDIWKFSFSKEDLQKTSFPTSRAVKVKLVFRCIYSLSPVSYNCNVSETDKKSKLTKNSTDILSTEKDSSNDEVECLLYLQNDLRNLLVTKKFADIKLRAGNEIFSAHKNLLASRSAVLSAMLDQDKVKSLSGTVDIIDVDAKMLNLFLEYIYTGTIEKMDEDIALNMLVVADRYEIFSLAIECSTFLEFLRERSSEIRNRNDSEAGKSSQLTRNRTGCLSFEEHSRAGRVLYLKHLQHDLRNLLVSKQFADIKLRAGKKIFLAHKNLLAARSTILSAMLDQDIVESQSGTVDIVDVDAKTLELFLEYIYTGSIEKMEEEIALNLLVVADKYKIFPLIRKCSAFLKSILSHTNVYKILIKADAIDNEYLKASSIAYVVNNSKKLLSSPDWLQLLKRKSMLSKEILLKLSNKFDVSVKHEIEETPGSSKESHLPTVNLKEEQLVPKSSKEISGQNPVSNLIPDIEAKQLDTIQGKI